jgi:hypothetical protein
VRALVRTTKPKAFTLTHTIADEAEPDIARTIRTAFLEARRSNLGVLDQHERVRE